MIGPTKSHSWESEVGHGASLEFLIHYTAECEDFLWQIVAGDESWVHYLIMTCISYDYFQKYKLATQLTKIIEINSNIPYSVQIRSTNTLWSCMVKQIKNDLSKHRARFQFCHTPFQMHKTDIRSIDFLHRWVSTEPKWRIVVSEIKNNNYIWI